MSLLPPINNNKQTQNVVRSSTFGKQDKLPEINKTNRLEAIFKKLDLRDDEVVSGTNDVNKTSKEHQLILEVFEEYDDSDFHSEFYQDESSMKIILSLFSRKGYDLNRMSPSELGLLTDYIDRKKEPWKRNFLLQLISCQLHPDFCYGDLKRKRDDDDDDDDDDENSVYNPNRTRRRRVDAGKKKSKKSRRNRKKTKRNKTRRRKTV